MLKMLLITQNVSVTSMIAPRPTCHFNRHNMSCNFSLFWKIVKTKNIDFGLDAKFRFDDNAEYRQKELFKYRDFSQEDPKEVAATKYDLNYIALDGAIGMFP